MLFAAIRPWVRGSISLTTPKIPRILEVQFKDQINGGKAAARRGKHDNSTIAQTLRTRVDVQSQALKPY